MPPRSCRALRPLSLSRLQDSWKTITCAAVLMLGVLGSAAGSDAAPRKPNIVIILADDLGYGDVGCYGATKIQTPRMDQLAREGLRFTDAHTPSAVCTPTRYGLLTGRYAWRSRLKQGVLNGESPALIEPGRETIASFLKSHGYVTAGIGKWHLGLGTAEKTDYAQPLRPGPVTVGFDSYFGIPASLDMVPYVYFENDRVEALPTVESEPSPKPNYFDGVFWRNGPAAPDFRHIDVLPRLAHKAEEFIAAQSTDRPSSLPPPDLSARPGCPLRNLSARHPSANR
ncbi:MAG: sulfatase-like hydrolase/transferase [Planctomycetaceae bacterium]